MALTRRAVVASALAMPAIARAQDARVLRFIPHADLSTLDPHWNTAYVTRNHGFMVFDTLYGTDSQYRATPQMVDGHTVDDDGLRWTLTLRDGLRFHDGAPVLARDCVASVKRWGAKDAYGQALLAATDDLSADGDKRIVFRLRRPFPLLPDALAKSGVYMPAMMPERLARTDPNTQVTEMVGSGPFRFLPDERLPGARAAYARFDGYVPRPSGATDRTAGPKVVHLDRVEWTTVPDAATAAAALQRNETDWWDYASADLLPVLRRNTAIKSEIQDPAGQVALLRLNHLQPPFNNPAVRRAVLGMVDQADYMTAIMGTDTTLWRTGAGVFTPGTPLATDIGMEALTSPRDPARSRRALMEAGYNNEPVALVVPTDFPNLKALADVGADMMRRGGLNVDYQATDWGTLLTRRAKTSPVAEGGWSCFFTFGAGLDNATPASHLMMRANGPKAWFGWPEDAALESLRDGWFAAPDLPAQQAIARQLQARAFEVVPFVPLGQYFQPTAYRTSLSGVLSGFSMFWNVRKA